MKNTIYTVPEGFFEKVQLDAHNGAHAIRKRRYAVITGISSLAVIAVVAFVGFGHRTVPQTMPQQNPSVYLAGNTLSDQEIIEEYEADIFLNVFEY